MATRIRVRLRVPGADWPRFLALACLVALLSTLVAWTAHRASASARTVNTTLARRHYFITDLSYYPDEALTACAAGYHFASLWEIADPSSLTYNTALGQTTLDSGGGPPTIQGLGWVRTGYNFSDVSTTPGHANCDNWTSRSNVDNGSVAVLPHDWAAGVQDMHVWDVGTRACDFKLGVWCAQDALQFQYMPALMKR